jgi:hypothetical protein
MPGPCVARHQVRLPPGALLKAGADNPKHKVLAGAVPEETAAELHALQGSRRPDSEAAVAGIVWVHPPVEQIQNSDTFQRPAGVLSWPDQRSFFEDKSARNYPATRVEVRLLGADRQALDGRPGPAAQKAASSLTDGGSKHEAQEEIADRALKYLK